MAPFPYDMAISPIDCLFLSPAGFINLAMLRRRKRNPTAGRPELILIKRPRALAETAVDETRPIQWSSRLVHDSVIALYMCRRSRMLVCLVNLTSPTPLFSPNKVISFSGPMTSSSRPTGELRYSFARDISAIEPRASLT